MLFLLLFWCSFDWSLACWGGGVEEENVLRVLGMIDPNDKKHWGGWPAPKGADVAWKNWMDLYKKEHASKGGYFEPNSTGKPYGYNIPGFPSDWKGLGEPFTGLSPPPWAYVPKKFGKPSYCYLSPLLGDCDSPEKRYGYNPYTDTCQTFIFSGCGGNQNNFKDLKKCEDRCIHPATSGCSPESGIPVDYIVAS